MTRPQFYQLARELFGSVLCPLGFTCERSKTSVFYREVAKGVYHVVMPDLGTRGVWYDVKVFPYASVFDPSSAETFPNGIGVPTDNYCYLSEFGVGFHQEQFNCKSEENFRRRFENTVGPLLKSAAIPYLAQFSSLNDLLPHIRRPLSYAIAVYFVHGRDAALDLLRERQQWLKTLDATDEKVASLQRYIDRLIETPT